MAMSANIGQNLQPFTCNVDVSIWGEKYSWVGHKTTNNQTIKRELFNLSERLGP